MMTSICDTQIAGISFAIDALRLYCDGDFKIAISKLIEILDKDPRNWYAHLMLGACYYNTNDLAAARREFQSVYKKCPEVEFVRMSVEGYAASLTTMMINLVEVAPEFGCYSDRGPATKPVTWLDEEQSQARRSQYTQRRKIGWRAKMNRQLWDGGELINPFLLHPHCWLE
jgi:tetratricopeptide (TPR) repeat protein